MENTSTIEELQNKIGAIRLMLCAWPDNMDPRRAAEGNDIAAWKFRADVYLADAETRLQEISEMLEDYEADLMLPEVKDAIKCAQNAIDEVGTHRSDDDLNAVRVLLDGALSYIDEWK